VTFYWKHPHACGERELSESAPSQTTQKHPQKVRNLFREPPKIPFLIQNNEKIQKIIYFFSFSPIFPIFP
jgi:hypothetical protein